MDHSMPGFPVHHQLLELTQTHVHWAGDVIYLSHLLSPSSPPALNLSQHQGLGSVSQLFTSGGQSTGASASTSALPMNIQGWFPLGLSGLISLLTKELLSLLQHHSLKGTVLQCSAFFMAQLSHLWACLVGQLVKNLSLMQETPVWFLGQEDPWRRDRLPTPVFLGFPGGSAGKEWACNKGDLGSISGLGRSPGEGNSNPL